MAKFIKDKDKVFTMTQEESSDMLCDLESDNDVEDIKSIFGVLGVS